MGQTIEHEILDFSFSAKVDMSTGGSGPGSTYQYCAVKLTTVAFQVDLAGTGPGIGILQNAPKLNSAAGVRLLGISQMIVDGTTPIAAGDYLKLDGSSRGIKTTADKDVAIAIALEPSTAANDQIAVLVIPRLTLSL